MVYWACFLDLEILFLMNKYVKLDLIGVKIIFDAVVKGNEERICVSSSSKIPSSFLSRFECEYRSKSRYLKFKYVLLLHYCLKK